MEKNKPIQLSKLKCLKCKKLEVSKYFEEEDGETREFVKWTCANTGKCVALYGWNDIDNCTAYARKTND